MKHTQTICNAAVVALLAAIAWVAACASRTPSAAKASLSADQEAGGGGNLQVSLKSADATFGMTRLALVGADLEFDLTTLVAGAAATKSYRLPLGGPSNAWTETRKAISESTMAAAKKTGRRYVLWAAGDQDQWWEGPAAEKFLRTIPTGLLIVP